jgi:hypothetical protein
MRFDTDKDPRDTMAGARGPTFLAYEAHYHAPLSGGWISQFSKVILTSSAKTGRLNPLFFSAPHISPRRKLLFLT